MPPAATTDVTIHHHHGVYRIPRDHPHPEAIRRRLDAVARNRLATLMDRLLSGLLAGDDAVWFVRDLEIRWSGDVVAFDDEAVASAWARSIASTLRRVLAAGADGSRVLRFDGRAEFLASFLYDCARDRARDRWYYAEFDSLRILGASRACTEALLREPEQIAPVLRRLEERTHLRCVLRALTETDAERLLDELGADGDQRRVDRVLFGVAVEALRDGAALPGLSRAALSLSIFAGAASHPVSAGRECDLARAATAVSALTEMTRSTVPAGSLAQALRDGGAEGLRGWLREEVPDQLPRLEPLLSSVESVGAEWLEQVARVIGTGSASRSGSEDPEQVLESDFVGLFLLVPSYAALGLEDRIQGDPARRRRVLAGCFGQERVGDALRDPAFAWIAPPPGSEESPAQDTGKARSNLGSWHSGRSVSGPWLVFEHVSAPEAGLEDVLLVRNAADGAWLWAARVFRRNLADGIECALRDAGRALDDEIRGVAFRGEPIPEITDAVARAGHRFHWITGADDEPPPLATYLARAPDAVRDLAHLLRREAPDLADALSSRAVLDDFASRLPGFGWSSVPFLLSNFLQGRGRVRRRSESLEVALPASPLRLVLRMAGFHGMTYEAPWPPGLRVTLKIPGD